MLNKKKLFETVFAPTPNDVVLFLVDTPHNAIKDTPDWADRRAMAEEWRTIFSELPLRVLPLFSYPATGANNGDLPEWGESRGQPARLQDLLDESTIAVAMTQYSATAPLSGMATRHGSLRVASMPGVLRRMEESALAADYAEVARRTHILAKQLTEADRADVTFSTGDEVSFDLRNRLGHADDGLCRPGKPFPLINLPSGEAFIVPYEGERDNEPSQTQGRIPVDRKGERFVLVIEENRITHVEGDGPEARAFAAYLAVDGARRNVAELGLGCNDQAVVRGVVLEDEKAGFHWAFGRSEHLGGVTGPDQFTDPAYVVHHDIVYARESPIGIRSLTLHFPEGPSREIMRDSQYIDL